MSWAPCDWILIGRHATYGTAPYMPYAPWLDMLGACANQNLPMANESVVAAGNVGRQGSTFFAAELPVGSYIIRRVGWYQRTNEFDGIPYPVNAFDSAPAYIHLLPSGDDGMTLRRYDLTSTCIIGDDGAPLRVEYTPGSGTWTEDSSARKFFAECPFRSSEYGVVVMHGKFRPGRGRFEDPYYPGRMNADPWDVSGDRVRHTGGTHAGQAHIAVPDALTSQVEASFTAASQTQGLFFNHIPRKMFVTPGEWLSHGGDMVRGYYTEGCPLYRTPDPRAGQASTTSLPPFGHAGPDYAVYKVEPFAGTTPLIKFGAITRIDRYAGTDPAFFPTHPVSEGGALQIDRPVRYRFQIRNLTRGRFHVNIHTSRGAIGVQGSPSFGVYPAVPVWPSESGADGSLQSGYSGWVHTAIPQRDMNARPIWNWTKNGYPWPTVQQNIDFQRDPSQLPGQIGIEICVSGDDLPCPVTISMEDGSANVYPAWTYDLA